MSPIKSFSQETYDSIKQYCLSCDPSLNLSEKIKLFLSDDVSRIIDKLDNKDPNVTVDEFLSLVDNYFKTLDFCYGNYDDDRLQLIKEDIGNMFAYIDSLNLSKEFSFSFINNFFDRLNDYDDEESRGIYDLLTLDSVKNSRIMKEFLSNPDNLYCNLINFVRGLYNCLDEMTNEEKEKVDYIFRSSYETLVYFISYSSEIDVYFNKNIISNFNKESLSLLFRMARYEDYREFFKSNEKFLKVVAKMNEYVLETTGHNSDLFDKLLVVFDSHLSTYKSVFIDVFTEYYDKYFEKGLEKGLDKDEIFNEILSFTLDPNSINFIDKYLIFGLDDLLKSRRKSLEDMYARAFGKLNILNIKYGVLDLDKDLIEYSNYQQLLRLKDAFFYRIYGIDSNQATYISRRYGEFLEECEDYFLDEDKPTLEMLKTICSVANLDVDDKDKIRELQISFYKYIKDNGLFKTNKNASFAMVRSLIDRMYMKTYNEILYKPSLDNVLYYQRGVPVIDAGVEFNMIVNSINGVGEFFRKKDNAKSRYNTTSDSNNQGLCTSFINNENLGVISLNGPLLAYNNIDISTLTAMGIGDIYSETSSINLRGANTTCGEGNYFFTPKKLADYTRFGYNELVFDRFLFKDDDTSLKVQPSHVVVYKMDNNYKETRMYKKGLKMAKEFGIPLVLVDVKKVKENERNKIISMEKELFSKKEVDKDLMEAIITRYMNNYSGTITICRSRDKRGNKWDYKRDFSVVGLNKFIGKVARRFEGLAADEIMQWYDALKECYDLEKKKNKYTHEITSYEHSLENDEFLLDDVTMFMDRIDSLKNRYVSRSLVANGQVEKDRISYNPRKDGIAELDVIVDLSNFLFDSCAYVTMEDSGGKRIFLTKAANSLSDEEKTDYGLIISYLLGNYNDNYFSNLDGCDLENLYFNRHNDKLKTGLINSEVYCDSIRKNSHLIGLAEKVLSMENDKFIKMFQPVIDKTAYNYNVSSKQIVKSLIQRKDNISYYFSNLPERENELSDDKVSVKKR